MKVSNYFLVMLGLALCFVFLQPSTVEAQTGSLRVTIGPEEARNAGAQWRRVGEIEWRDSGTTETGITTGSYEVEFKDISGWDTPGNRSVTIQEGETASLTVNYSSPTGSIKVFLEPEAARIAGAGWLLRAQGGLYRNSGDIMIDIPAGDHVITFRDATGWLKPADQLVTIVAGETTEATFEYTPDPGTLTGSLSVNINPPAVRDAGAQWRRMGTGIWFNSGDTEINIPEGDHLVEFSDVDGWTKPNNIVVNIQAGQTSTENGTYTILPPDTGSLRVTIDPQGVRDAGAQWRRMGTGTWFNSGDTETNIPAGNYVVEFIDIVGWAKPANIPVTIVAEQLTSISASYFQGGSLQVIMEPGEAVEAGAGWRIEGLIPDLDQFPDGWYNADITTVDGLRPGEYTLIFREIPGWTRPADRDVTIERGEMTFLTVIYTTHGALQVMIEPKEARDSGAQWRRVGTLRWLNSGEVEEGLRADDYEVEFRSISGWDKPGILEVSVEVGQTAILSGQYTISTEHGALQVFIEPEAAVHSGALWRRVGTNHWYHSGHVETGFPEGTYTIEFKDIYGWDRSGNKSVVVYRGHSSTVTGFYIQHPLPPPGSLLVMITPQEAVDLGAQWRRTGTQNWLDSGELESDVPVGEHQVEFRTIEGWVKPGNSMINIEPDSMFSTNLSYLPVPAADTYYPSTGITRCFSDSEEIPCPSPDESYYGQDAQNLVWPSRSYACFKPETGLAGDVVECRDDQGFFNQETAVYDRITGLMWQQLDDGRFRDYYAANVYCSNLDLGGYLDWRLPTVNELFSLVDRSRLSPAIDSGSLSASNSTYWTDKEYGDFHLSIRFYDGSSSTEDNFGLVRCVRGVKWPAYAAYVDNNDGSVTDTGTGLTWKKDSNDEKVNWVQALSYCHNLESAGHTDWRLPNITELLNNSYHSSQYLWSSSTVAGKNAQMAWLQFASQFQTLPENKDSLHRAVCVRGGRELDGQRVMDWAEWLIPELFPAADKQTVKDNFWYIRHYPEANTYLGSLAGYLYFYDPDEAPGHVHDFGLLKDWLTLAGEDGF